MRESGHEQVLILGIQIAAGAHYSDQSFKALDLGEAELVSSEFYDCVFSRCSFAGSILQSCRFVGCTFKRCDLSLLRVPQSAFSSTRFEDCRVVGVNWAEAKWPSVGLADPLGFQSCAISHSTFMGLKLRGMQVKDCVALDVDFREADLSEADFAGTDLSQSLFGDTNLSQADLSRACNYDIDPGLNVLRQARFSLPEALSLLHSMDIVLVDDV